MRRAALLCAIVAALTAPAGAFAVTPKTSLPDIEDEVMCVTCKIPLNVAESPQADDERALIRQLIATGRDKQQIKAELVKEYGDDVLALPDSSGFGMTAYLIPFVLLALLAGTLALLLPKWRKRAPAGIGDLSAARLGDDDARRLDDDLGHYD